MLGDRGQPDLEVRPLGLQPFLHPVEDVRSAAGGGEHLEPVVGQAHDGAVVDDHPVDTAHHAVAGHPDLEAAHEIRVEHVEELARVRSLDIDLAQRGTIEDTDSATDSGTFAQHRVVHAFPGSG